MQMRGKMKALELKNTSKSYNWGKNILPKRSTIYYPSEKDTTQHTKYPTPEYISWIMDSSYHSGYCCQETKYESQYYE
jgi:hypothetical protein